jgi:ubiquinol-cytochrome c reductase cytochrome c subunit
VLVLAAGALAGSLAACSGGGSSKPSAEQITLGRAIYAQQCARCHGVSGEGGVGPRLAGVMKSTFPKFDDQVTFVENGGGGMPRFADLLSKSDIEAVVAYTRESLG